MKHEIEKAKRGMGKDCYHAEEVLSIAKQFSATRDELYLAARELTKRDFRYEPETRANDYQIDVLAVNLAEADELAMLAFLNNPSSQGEFDTDLLAALNLDFGVDFADMGFSKADVDYLFDGDARFSDLFVDDPAEVKETKGKLNEIKAHRKESTEKMKEAQSGDFYFVVVARDQAEKDEVMKRIGVPNYERFISADAVLGVLDVKQSD
jgi:hypothetical protein